MAKTAPKSSESIPEDTRDLGFGGKVSQRAKGRFLNRDGTFNVSRRGISILRSTNMYHALLMMRWSSFFGMVSLIYIAINGLFAAAYHLAGPGTLQGASFAGSQSRWLDDLFFSVQTLSTVGYGGMLPRTLAANVIVSAESLAGILFVAISMGLIFARFSRPVAKILFSKNAVIAPFRGMTAFQFRIVNARKNQLVGLEAKLIFSRIVETESKRTRIFEELALERQSVTFFPLHWTIVHPIDEKSPMRGLTMKEFEQQDAEFIILLSGFDETFSQVVHARSSYKYHETVVGAKFADMFIDSSEGQVAVDIAKLHDIEPAGLESIQS